MKDLSIVITTTDWEGLRQSLFTADGNENGGVLLAGMSETSRARRLLVRQFIPVPLDAYIGRESYHLEITPAFYNDVVTKCLRDRLSPVIVHSHPHSEDAWYSPSDDFGEKRLLGALGALLPKAWPASLVMTRNGATGREFRDGDFRRLTGVSITGVRSQKYPFTDSKDHSANGTDLRFDRQVRAFGEAGQALLRDLKIAVIGVGGIGSLVIEQMVRAGLRDIILVDDDKVEESNVSRLFGATTADNGKPKVTVVAAHLKTIGAASVKTIAKSAISQSVLMQLRDRDIVFACVDNDRTRAILNRFACQYLIPVIDHGTRLDGRQGKITAAAGRVSVVGSGLVCLRCSHHINAERIRAESMSSEERRQLEKEGYIIGIDEPAPAVVTINSVVASLGATAGMNLFVALTGGPQPPDQIYDATSGSVFPVTPIHEHGCDVCDPDLGVKGLGDNQIVSAYE